MNASIENRPLDPIPREGDYRFTPPCDNKPASATFFAFNTLITLSAYGAEEACAQAFSAARDACRVYERLFSRTLPHSDIARINGSCGTRTEIDPRTFDLLERALYYCAESEGAFDITVGPAVALWDFRRRIVPKRDKLADAVAHVSWRNLKLTREDAAAEGAARVADAKAIPSKPAATASHENAPGLAAPGKASAPGLAAPDGTATARSPRHAQTGCFACLADPLAAVDAGGIAKGWIADALDELMRAYDLGGYIINLGGNVVVRGTKPAREPWRVGIRDPRNPDKLLGAVPLASGSAVTSGIYERGFTGADGTRYHHILDPKTGMPVQTDVAGVTVITDKSIDAEGFSTTLLALGTERGIDLARRHPEIRQAFFVSEEGRVTTVH